MTVLATTRVRLSTPPDNRRGRLEAATWRFALPDAAATARWIAPDDGAATDVTTLGRHCRLEVTSPLQPSALPGAVDLLVVEGDRPSATDGARTVVRRRDTSSATGLTLLHRDGQLRGVVASGDAVARQRLEALLGPSSRRHGRTAERGLDVSRTSGAPIVPAAPPAWVRDAVAAAGHPVDEHHWLLWCRGDYGSQKLIMFLVSPDDPTADAVVKITRQPEFNDRLLTEAAVLRHLELAGVGDGRLPRVIASGEHWGSSFCIESAVAGTPLREVAAASRPRLLDDGADFLVRLGAATARTTAPAEVAPVLDDLVAECGCMLGLERRHADFLHEQVRRLVDVDAFPVVVQHGDPGVWNAIARTDGTVGLLDWEAGEEHGMPLWDLVYFLRSAVLLLRPAQRWERTIGVVRRHMIHGSPMTGALASHLAEARGRLGLPVHTVEPLVHLCWAHRALKEATRRAPEDRAGGHYAQLLRACVDHRDDPGFRRLVGTAS